MKPSEVIKQLNSLKEDYRRQLFQYTPEQQKEYELCLLKISKILNKPKNQIKYMSHPCGSYNNDTLQILNNLGIKLGFKQIMTVEPEKGMKKINNSSLEIARQDHSGIFKRMN